ncbi:ATP-binding protein [Lutimaribacter sp. EGI FJ00015]|uniref:ATP-binding protein n=1 Tax=Lutimaribacter degradans TaxID=2945989 RepID=A0ACC5ZWR0_9RHOB|nr:ATP-binding protein [Lutimaribacter sp. EGI FJ00013]MCM2562793.1 ATP-binding protein [Lutimaribacter sp. EGI FJ00013]MCO0613950.1 ATP-binding protein [Lutimaribacter sp. EGI FJ00015]MCO0636922.1 ATP-binding protein [Lutimaribacter sp. EGI FJ00014]
MADRTKVGMVWAEQAAPHENAAFIIRFHASPLNVRDALRLLLGYLDPLDLPIDQVATIQIVLAEVLNNVTEHAYDSDGGLICMQANVVEAGLSVTIRDRGAALPPKLILSEGSGGFDPQALPEGGFGWHLIRSLASELAHCRQARWNELKIVFSLGGPQSDELPLNRPNPF